MGLIQGNSTTLENFKSNEHNKIVLSVCLLFNFEKMTLEELKKNA